ncbi:hypothetical protein LTR78_005934 [Recurvomyces mirabilis]|uniref:Uncharacterized protein n=1 Tax=Recurvomyces mirabilis TaxID=574656 RepID=A0AAE0WLV9_9PEZI|nr:hypothetical protein LTR78_005934 [Recurvomyces mirabilis]KAK5155256.1 hypothetical protein LTS14_006211 [Recurvomyces mirabilis]
MPDPTVDLTKAAQASNRSQNPTHTPATLASLTIRLEGDALINPDEGEDAIHLIKAALEQHSHQTSPNATLYHHITYCVEHIEKLNYFPFGFLIVPAVEESATDQDVLWLAHVNFEEPCDVTAFRIQYKDAEECCAPLRDDDVSVEEMREMHEVRRDETVRGGGR